jgi:hypothetical protein
MGGGLLLHSTWTLLCGAGRACIASSFLEASGGSQCELSISPASGQKACPAVSAFCGFYRLSMSPETLTSDVLQHCCGALTFCLLPRTPVLQQT